MADGSEGAPDAAATGAPTEATGAPGEAAGAPIEAPGAPGEQETTGAPVDAEAAHEGMHTPPGEPKIGAPLAASTPIAAKTSILKTTITTPLPADADAAEGEKLNKTNVMDITPKNRLSFTKDDSGLEASRSFSQTRASKGTRRKQSNYFSMLSIKRGSFSSYQERTKTPRYMNTYKLHSERPFNGDKVHAIIVKVLKDIIVDSMTYDPETCPGKAKLASALIRTKVKEQDFERYKLICLVTIGEKKSYDIFTGVRFLWDSERDRFATYMHENMYVFAVASVFGLYYE